VQLCEQLQPRGAVRIMVNEMWILHHGAVTCAVSVGPVCLLWVSYWPHFLHPAYMIATHCHPSHTNINVAQFLFSEDRHWHVLPSHTVIIGMLDCVASKPVRLQCEFCLLGMESSNRLTGIMCMDCVFRFWHLFCDLSCAWIVSAVLDLSLE
jgi:hypothetical protein